MMARNRATSPASSAASASPKRGCCVMCAKRSGISTNDRSRTPKSAGADRDRRTLLQRPRLLERRRTAHDGDAERAVIQVDRQRRPGLGPHRELAVARHDHDGDALPRRDDLVVRLDVEREVVELPRYELLARELRVVVATVRERAVVLRIG